jgi:hypothetical protein
MSTVVTNGPSNIKIQLGENEDILEEQCFNERETVLLCGAPTVSVCGAPTIITLSFPFYAKYKGQIEQH